MFLINPQIRLRIEITIRAKQNNRFLTKKLFIIDSICSWLPKYLISNLKENFKCGRN
jgi:hypothetical protein